MLVFESPFPVAAETRTPEKVWLLEVWPINLPRNAGASKLLMRPRAGKDGMVVVRKTGFSKGLTLMCHVRYEDASLVLNGTLASSLGLYKSVLVSF